MTEIDFYEQFVPGFVEYEDVYYMFKDLIEHDAIASCHECNDSEQLKNELRLQILRKVYPYCVIPNESMYDEIDDLLTINTDSYISCERNNCYWIDIEQLQENIKNLSEEHGLECTLIDPKEALNKMNKNLSAKFVN